MAAAFANEDIGSDTKDATPGEDTPQFTNLTEEPTNDEEILPTVVIVLGMAGSGKSSLMQVVDKTDDY